MILLLRGAPGVGKSTIAVEAAVILGGGPAVAVIEVDDLRGDLWHTPAIAIPEDDRYVLALGLAARVAMALLEAGVGRVIVVDTFAAWAARVFQKALRGRALARAISLLADDGEIGHRLATRPERPGVFRDSPVARALNAELAAEADAARLDTSGCRPREVAAHVVGLWTNTARCSGAGFAADVSS